MTNHDIIIASAKELFLKFKADDICKRLSLKYDKENIFINFLGDTYSVSKTSGDISCSDGHKLSYHEYLIIFDVICRDGSISPLIGNYAPVNSLGNMVHPGVSETMLYQDISPIFGANVEKYCKACLSLGGRDFPIGDHSYVIDVFDFFPAVIQLWEADDEFPASVRLLWDENSLNYFKYETIWYVAGSILQKISQLIGK